VRRIFKANINAAIKAAETAWRTRGAHPIAGTLLVRGIAKGTRGTVLWLWSTPDLRANSGMPPIAANPKITGKRPRAKEARLHAEQLFFNRLFVAISTIWSKWQHYPVKDVQNLMDIKVFYNLV